MRVQNKNKRIKKQGKEKSISFTKDTHMPRLMLLIHDGLLDRLAHHLLSSPFSLPPLLCSRKIDLNKMISLVICLTKCPKP